MSRYRFDPTRIEMADTDTRARGGQGIVFVGTLTHPGALNIPLPKITEEVYPKFFETLLCNKSNELHLEAVEKLFAKYSPGSVFEAFKRWQAEASKEEISERLRETVFQAFKEIIFGKKVAVKKLKWPCDDAGKSPKIFKVFAASYLRSRCKLNVLDQSFVNELSLMASLSHPNVIEFLGFVEDMSKGDAWIILPWEANGNVREFLQSGEWDIPERISLIQDVAKGLEYLHSRDPPICHGDLKSLNILINSSSRAVITDFGSARIRRSVASENHENQEEMLRPVLTTDDTSAESSSPLLKFHPLTSDLTLTGPAFSLRWTAPEVLAGTIPDLPSDMWAMGWICWEIITGRLPFDKLEREETVILYTMERRLPAIRTDLQLSHVLSLCSIMSECWLLKPIRRIDASAFRQKVDMMPSVVPSGITSGGQKARSAALLMELGRNYELQNDRANAEAHYQLAINIATRTKDDLVIAYALQCLGRIRGANANLGEAESLYRQAQEIYFRIGNSLGVANVLGGLGEIFRRQSRHQEAERAFNDARETHCCIGNDLGTGNALFGLGNTYQAQSRSREAEKAFIEALGIYSRVGNDLGAGNALFGLGTTYQVQSRNREAEKAFMEAQEIHSRIGNYPGAASALDGLLQVRRTEPEYQEAESALKDAQETHPSTNNHPGAASAFFGPDNTYLAQSKDPEAEKAFLEAYKIHSCLGNDAGIANALDGLGKVYLAQSRKEEAGIAFTEACRIYSRIGDDLGAANAFLGLGNTHVAQSRNSEAERAFSEAHEIYSRIGNHSGAAQALRGLEKIHGAASNVQDAEKVFPGPPTIPSPLSDDHSSRNASVLALYDRANDCDSSTRTLPVPGKRHHTQHQHLETEQAVTKALAIATSFAHRQGQAATSQLLAKMLQSQVPRGEEVDGLIQEEAVYAQTGDHMRRAWTWDRMGDVFLAQGEYTKAEESYQFAQAIYSSINCAAGEGETLRDRGWLYIHQGRHAEAEECLIQARLTYAIIYNEYGEARALDGLTVVHALQGRFRDAKFASVEAWEIYTRLGRPISDICTYLSTLLRVLEENPDLMALYESLQDETSGFLLGR
ncbi:hypothetical protein FRC00_008263 [Tulasnella sp. 408]|nr:hypothetical protein FRC00_008263 [Tulasnella sp. 408]